MMSSNAVAKALPASHDGQDLPHEIARHKILAVVCLLLFVVLLLVKREYNARHQADTDSLADCSNRLALAQANIGERDASLLNLSNVLAQCQSASTALSNQLTETIVTQSQQLTNLTLQIAQMAAPTKFGNGASPA